MKKGILLQIFLLMLTTSTISQSTNFDLTNKFDTTDLIIRGKDLDKFVSNNITDLLNGLFPAVFSITPNTNNYLFVVNGFLLTDINSIDLNDIEEVRFSYNRENIETLPFARTGVFYIKTKHGSSSKGEWNFTTNIGFNLKDNRAFINKGSSAGFATENHSFSCNPGFLNFNHLSYKLSKPKFNLYLAGKYNFQSNPAKSEKQERYDYQISEIVNSTIKQQEKLYSFLGTLQYTPIPNLAMKLSISSTNLNKQSSFFEDYIFNNNGIIQHSYKDYNSSYDVTVLNAAFKINWKFVKFFTNDFSIEYLSSQYKYTKKQLEVLFPIGTNTPLPAFKTNTDGIYQSRLKGMLLLRNTAKVEFDISKKLKSEIGIIISLLNPNHFFDSNIRTYNASTNATSSLKISNASNYNQTNSVNPYLKLNYKNIIQTKVGISYTSSQSISTSEAYTWKSENIYSTSTIDLKKLFSSKKTNELLTINFTYTNFLNNSSKYQFVSSAFQNDEPSISFLNEEEYPWQSPYNQYMQWKHLRNKALSFYLNTTLSNQRVKVMIGWIDETKTKQRLLQYLYGYPNVIYLTMIDFGQEVEKNFVFQLNGQLIKTSIINLNTVINISLPKNEYDDITISNIQNSNQSSARIGWYNSITIKKFFCSFKSLFEIGHEYYNLIGVNGYEKNKQNNFNLSNIALGYTFFEKEKKKILKNTSIWLEANNLIQSSSISTNHWFYKYLGIGLSHKF